MSNGNDLEKIHSLNTQELVKLAKAYDISGYTTLPRNELIFRILKSAAEQEGLAFITGCLDIMEDGYGFLRFPENNYIPSRDDIYVSLTQIKKIQSEEGTYGLRSGPVSERG